MFENGQQVTVDISSDAATSQSAGQRFEQIKTLLQKEFGDTAYRSWILPIEAVSCAGGTLSLSVPTRFIRDWVKTHYADRMRSLWTQHFGAIARVEVAVSGKKPDSAAAPAGVAYERPAIANENAAPPAAADDFSVALDPRYTFDNFVTGSSNEFAFAAARKIADNEKVTFNPLFLQGGVGLGKTHLMHAIAHAARANGRKVAYMSAEKFMYDFVRALRFQDTMSFKAKFRSVDVLMIDDIQFICGKDATQEEFFHTFNALIDQGKQIVISADQSPADMDGLEERLRSRLSMGLVAAIHPTTYELRLGILQSKCAQMKRNLPQDVLEFLAAKITSNVRELEGALNRLIAHAELVNRAVTVETAFDLLADILRANDRRTTIEDIQRKVAEHYGIRLSDMHSPRRARPVARPRQLAMYLCKQLTTHSLPEIGRKFGGRDHTTIIHGVRKIEELLATDATLRDDVDTLKRAMAV
ncbi:MAG TPA: chromosomal replication initiator protein DnaA [Patescibacteria group bacterium]|nr:chromosomal replication initiator protein DnaA [Patescibacteria group bacterium]